MKSEKSDNCKNCQSDADQQVTTRFLKQKIQTKNHAENKQKLNDRDWD